MKESWIPFDESPLQDAVMRFIWEVKVRNIYSFKSLKDAKGRVKLQRAKQHKRFGYKQKVCVTKDAKNGDILCTFRGEVVSYQTVLNRLFTRRRAYPYVFPLTDDIYLDCACMKCTNLGVYVRPAHSKELSNARLSYSTKYKVLCIRASKFIKKAEEIIIDCDRTYRVNGIERHALLVKSINN